MNKYKIEDDIYSLSYFKPILNISNQIEFIGDLEIVPFQKFSPEYGCTYWYFKYLLLRSGRIMIERYEIDDDYKAFFSQNELNIIWINIVDKSNYNIRCVDGIWYIEIYNEVIRPSNYQWILC